MLAFVKRKKLSMKKILMISCALIFLNSITAQETKTVVNDENAEIRSVANFTGIKVSGGVALYISQGNEHAVAISASDKKYNDKVITEVKNGILNIYLEKGAWNGWNWKNTYIKAYVTVKELEKLEASGASGVKIVEGINCSNLKLNLSGASTLKGEINANVFKVDASGASVITLTGKATNANIDFSGASVLRALDFTVENCKVDASGASSLTINVTKQLDAEASGASSIKHKGNASVTNISATGASSIKKMDR